MGDNARGIIFDSKDQTVGSFLERWLEDVIRPNKTNRTYSTHKQQVCSHIIPALGRIKLDSLRKVHIDWLYADLLRDNPEGSGLAPSSVRRVHAVLHAALEEAVRGDLILRNPAAHANKPKVRQEEIEPFDAQQAQAFLEAARGDRFETLYVLCIMAGLRQGEALGLKWTDIDLDAGRLRVNRQLQRIRRNGEKSGKLEFSEPKNASRRTVGLPQRSVEALKIHRKHQLEDTGYWRAQNGRNTGSCLPTGSAVPSKLRTSPTGTSSRCYSVRDYLISASMISGTLACPYSPNEASR